MAKLALLIGVSEYESGLEPLPGSLKDIEAMQRVLQHPEMGGFEITILPNPQRQEMEEAIENLFSSCDSEDLVLLYFSGHGITDDRGRLYLTNRQTRKNAQGELVKTRAVAASLIHEVMENSHSQRQVIILDACFSGAFAKGMKAKDSGIVDIKNQLGGEGRVVLTSSTATQYSFAREVEELSVYTRYLVEGIETGAADTDNNGKISVDELHEFAKKKVREAAPTMKPEIYAVKEGYKIYLAKVPKNEDDLSSEKGIDYTRLRDLLAAGEWNEANRETHLVMKKAVDKMDGGWFIKDELLSFPCTDLRTIDRLWVKYSNGKFGFSVQNEIYLYGIEEDRLFKALGWGMRRDRSIERTEVTSIESAKRGQLPHPVSIFLYEVDYDGFDEENPRKWYGDIVGFNCLMTRLVKCNI